MNRAPGFNKDLNGAMRGADANANDTWFTSPNQLRMSVMLSVLESFGLLQWISGRETLMSATVQSRQIGLFFERIRIWDVCSM